MEKVWELFIKKYSLITNNLESNPEIRIINDEILKKLKEYYKEKPLEFRYVYKKLKSNNENLNLVDLIDANIEKQVEYALYKSMRTLLKKENNQKETFLDRNKKYIYYDILNQIKAFINFEKYLKLQSLLLFLGIDTLNDLDFKKYKKVEQLDEKMASDRICVLECRSIEKKLEEKMITEEDRTFYQILEQAFLSAIHMSYLKEALLSELNEKSNIISFPDTKKRTIIRTR